MKTQLLVGLGAIAFVVLLGAYTYLPAKLNPPKPVSSQPRTDADGSLQVGDRTRLYDLYVPSSYTGEQPLPLVLAFHGVGGDGKSMEQLTGLSQLAEQEKFIVVYPDAIDKHWDTRRRVQPETTNDIGFISALIEELGQQYRVDPTRIYATGFSNGGMFAHRVACELSDKIAAGAVVAATMPENLSRTCQPAQPVSMLMIHGTNDPAIPYGPPGKALLSLADTVKYWTTHNRCSPQAVKEVLPDAAQVSLETYSGGSKGATVILYSVAGGTHAWPKPASETTTVSNNPDQAIDASTIIWDFFSNHPAQKD